MEHITTYSFAQLAATVEIGSNLLALLVPLVAALALALQNGRTNKHVKETRDQFANNGGSTMRDAIDRIELQTAQTATTVAGIDQRLVAVEAVQQLATVTPPPAAPAIEVEQP